MYTKCNIYKVLWQTVKTVTYTKCYIKDIDTYKGLNEHIIIITGELRTFLNGHVV